MMTMPGTVACPFHPRPRRRASRPHTPQQGVGPPPPVPAGRGPRDARLLALALRRRQLVQARLLAHYAPPAQPWQSSRARVPAPFRCLLLAPAG